MLNCFIDIPDHHTGTTERKSCQSRDSRKSVPKNLASFCYCFHQNRTGEKGRTDRIYDMI